MVCSTVVHLDRLLLAVTKLARNVYIVVQVLQSDIDLLHPPADVEKRSHKLKRLVQKPDSFFMDVKCQGCFQMYDLP